MLAATDRAEEILGKPPTFIQILIVVNNDYSIPVKDINVCTAIAFSLAREELLYFDKNLYYYSTKRHPGFQTYSECFRAKFTGYCLDSEQRLMATPGTGGAKTIGYDAIINILKSKDEKLLEKYKWMFEEETHFLDNTHKTLDGNKIAVNSFPRSGNTLARGLIEKVTGLATGSTSSLHTSTPL